MRKRAFTLFELISVIAIIGLVFIFGVIVVSLARKRYQERAQNERLLSIVQQAEAPATPLRYEKATVEGHEYLIFAGRSAVHNEACPCRAPRTGQ